MKVMADVKLYKAIPRCATCGECCKYAPGGYHPDQFENEEEIIDKLKSGYYSVDGDFHMCYLRPAMTTGYKKAIDDTWSGQCIFLTETGCRLDEIEKPIQCSATKPTSKSCNVPPNLADCYIKLAWANSKYNLFLLASRLLIKAGD